MDHQGLVIGQPLRLEVQWYDNCIVPERQHLHEGEVIGWRESQLIVRVKDYAVVRFWKRNGIEVGNKDHARRGFRIDLSQLRPIPAKPGVEVPFTEEGGC